MSDHPDIANASLGITALKEARAYFRAAGLTAVAAKVQAVLNAARSAQSKQREHHNSNGWRKS